LLVNSTTSTSYAITNIPPGSTCRFHLQTLNIVGYSIFSTPLSVLFAQIPDAPPTPAYVARSGGDASIGLSPFIQIEWQAPTEKGGLEILGYLVSMSVNSGPWQLAFDGSVRPEILEFKFQELQAGALYSFKVWARNELGYSATASPTLELYAATYPFKMDKLE
jgi:hypothetical protein